MLVPQQTRLGCGVRLADRGKKHRVMAVARSFGPVGGQRAAVRCRALGEEEEAPFDLQVAVMLGGAAFEAYNEPVAEKMYVESTVNNTMTTYVSRDYFSSQVQGIAKIKLHSASNLPARDLWGTSDPYVCLSIGESHAKTAVVDRNCNPVWDETLYLMVRDLEEQRLLVRVADKDMIGSDDALGMTLLPLSTCSDGERHELNLDLGGDGGGGTVNLTFEYIPFSDTSGNLTNIPLQAVEGTPTRVLDAWKTLAELVGGTLERLSPICYVDNVDTDTQAWVLWSPECRHVCVAFRGTEQTKFTDIITDLKVASCNFDVERSVGNFFDRSVPQVHSGFLQAYDSVKVKLMSIVASIMRLHPDEQWTLYITGHSLGGALATLFAADMSRKRYPEGSTPPRVTMYNFGSPRVGNAKFVEMYAETMSDSWRVFNKTDIVSSVPRMGNYKHVGNSVAVSVEHGIEVMGDHAIKDVLGEGSTVEDVVPQLLRKGLMLEENEELKALVDQELEILSALSTGAGVLAHLEDFYLSVFETIVQSITDGIKARVTVEQKNS